MMNEDILWLQEVNAFSEPLLECVWLEFSSKISAFYLVKLSPVCHAQATFAYICGLRIALC